MNAQQLKNAILQEAIEGRLVPQDLTDEPASALLERIRGEKERLVKEGKLKKKDLVVNPISEDEIPFDIPETWEWVRLVDIGIAETGTTPSKSHPEYFGTFIPFLGPANMLNGQIISETQGLSELGANYGRIVPEGSILQVCIGGSIGKCAIVDKPVTFNQQINSITPLVCVIEFIYYVLQSDYFRLAIKDKSTGTATPIINRGNWEQLAIPIPPLAEQKRIVSKIEELLPKVEEYGKVQDALNKLNAELPERLKKSILQEAIEGRLVPQDPNDEPASTLLAKIRQEKEQLVKEGKLKKKDLAVNPISEDEIPFDIPDSWEWVRIGDYANKVTDFVASGSFATLRENVKYYSDKEYAILVRTKDFQTNFQTDLVYTDKHGYDFLSNSNLRGGELILPNIGASIGKVFIVPKLDYPMTLAPNTVMIRFYWEDQRDWIYTLFCSTFGKALLNEISSSTAQGKFNKTDFKKLVIPLPPLAEQKRIVAKIEEVFAEIDKLKK